MGTPADHEARAHMATNWRRGRGRKVLLRFADSSGWESCGLHCACFKAFLFPLFTVTSHVASLLWSGGGCIVGSSGGGDGSRFWAVDDHVLCTRSRHSAFFPAFFFPLTHKAQNKQVTTLKHTQRTCGT